MDWPSKNNHGVIQTMASLMRQKNGTNPEVNEADKWVCFAKRLYGGCFCHITYSGGAVVNGSEEDEASC